MPNLFAYAMLFIWPLVMIGLFKNMAPDRALIWSFLGAFMLLPSGVQIDLSLIPPLDKFTIPSLVALVLCLTMTNQRIRILPSSTIASIFMIGFILSPEIKQITVFNFLHGQKTTLRHITYYISTLFFSLK